MDVDTMHGLTKDEARRANECESRRPLSCGRIDIKLGWVDRVPIEVCNACWAAGPSTHEGYAVRQDRITGIVEEVKSRGLHNYHPLVQVSVMGRFMTDTEAAAAKLRLEAMRLEAEQKAASSLWEGVPYPVRVVSAVAEAGRAFRRKLRSYKGCGCLKPVKRLFKKP